MFSNAPVIHFGVFIGVIPFSRKAKVLLEIGCTNGAAFPFSHPCKVPECRTRSVAHPFISATPTMGRATPETPSPGTDTNVAF
jgi:hypothetical protein